MNIGTDDEGLGLDHYRDFLTGILSFLDSTHRTAGVLYGESDMGGRYGRLQGFLGITGSNFGIGYEEA